MYSVPILVPGELDHVEGSRDAENYIAFQSFPIPSPSMYVPPMEPYWIHTSLAEVLLSEVFHDVSSTVDFA